MSLDTSVSVHWKGKPDKCPCGALDRYHPACVEAEMDVSALRKELCNTVAELKDALAIAEKTYAAQRTTDAPEGIPYVDTTRP